MLANPSIIRVVEEVRVEWRGVLSEVPNELEGGFEEALQQAAYTGILASLNCDPYRPRIHSTGNFSHMIDGRFIPATMSLFANPDVVYRFIPISSLYRYTVSGLITATRPCVSEFSIVTDQLMTTANLSASALERSSDNTFQLYLATDADSTSGGGVQIQEDSAKILIRDFLGDWGVERPIPITISRVDDDGPSERGIEYSSEECNVSSAIKHVRQHMNSIIGVTRRIFGGRANAWSNPEVASSAASAGGALVSQAYSRGFYSLRENEAVLIRVDPGDASYFAVTMSNIWSVTQDADCRTVSFNQTQAIQDDDGMFTFILCHKDPGLHNWLDTGGMSMGVVYVRWAGFGDGHDNKGLFCPKIQTELLRLSGLRDVIPQNFFSFGERARDWQLDKRRHDCDWRRSRL